MSLVQLDRSCLISIAEVAKDVGSDGRSEADENDGSHGSESSRECHRTVCAIY